MWDNDVLVYLLIDIDNGLEFTFNLNFRKNVLIVFSSISLSPRNFALGGLHYKTFVRQ